MIYNIERDESQNLQKSQRKSNPSSTFSLETSRGFSLQKQDFHQFPFSKVYPQIHLNYEKIMDFGKVVPL